VRRDDRDVTAFLRSGARGSMGKSEGFMPGLPMRHGALRPCYVGRTGTDAGPHAALTRAHGQRLQTLREQPTGTNRRLEIRMVCPEFGRGVGVLAQFGARASG